MRSDNEIVKSAINHIDAIQDSVKTINEIQSSPVVMQSFVANDMEVNLTFEVGNVEVKIQDIHQEYDSTIDEYAYNSNDVSDINRAAINSLALASLFDLKSGKTNRGEYLTQNPDVVDKITCLMLESTSSSTQPELYDIYERMYCLIRDTLTTQYEGSISRDVTERFEHRNVHQVSSQFDVHIDNGVREIEFL